jgi:hypothetical protein
MKKNDRWIQIPTIEKKKKDKDKDRDKKKEYLTKITSPFTKTSFIDDQNNNLKKILCENMIYNGECKYDKKCLYAHTIDEQNINEKRKHIYDLIDSTDDLSHIDLKKDYTLYKSLLELTKMCKKCITNVCIGGYNCKLGSCVTKYCICGNDLNNGFCKSSKCEYVHLSKRGLKPYYKKDKKHKKNSDNCTNGTNSSSNSSNSEDLSSVEITYKIDDVIDIFDDIHISDDDNLINNDTNCIIDNFEIMCEKSIFV